MESWYATKGIEHIRLGPKNSQLNLCERAHQSLVAMIKATMEHAGFSRSLWPEAMRNALYVKNRVYNKSTQGVPYEMMFAVKPDVHHFRKLGALAYAHVPVLPGRRKHHSNTKVGFALGLTSGGGCSISTAEVDEDGWSSLHFSQDDCSEMPTASDTIAPVLDESNSVPTVKLENGEYCEQLEDSGYNEQFVNEVNVKNNDYGEYGKPREHV
ncbi:hypothetical protein PC123_g2278 [Phytophthora cactorum]|nr:hypothetical protein PC123_g2278 [Phytophthora cactorum]